MRGLALPLLLVAGTAAAAEDLRLTPAEAAQLRPVRPDRDLKRIREQLLANPPEAVAGPVRREVIEGTDIAIVRLSSGSGGDIAQVDTFFGRPVYGYRNSGANLISRLLSDYGDRWEIPIVFTRFITQDTGGGAFYMPIYSDVAGIGTGDGDLRPFFGSSARGPLRGWVNMNLWWTCSVAWWWDCTESPPYDTTWRSLHGVLGQEVGHAWSAFLQIEDPRDGGLSSQILGRDDAHWSYYLHSGGSPLEGNNWVEEEEGEFRVQSVPYSKFSDLDLYAMGVMSEEEVQPTFFIDDPRPVGSCNDGCGPATPPESGPTRVRGERVDFGIDAVTAAMGRRSPSYEDAPKIVTSLITFAVREEDDTDLRLDVQKIENLRKFWNEYFYEATRTRMRTITTLDGRDDYPRFEFTISSEGWQGLGFDGLEERILAGAIQLPAGEGVGVIHENVRIVTRGLRTLEVSLATPADAPEGLARIEWRQLGADGWDGVDVALGRDGVTRAYTFTLSELTGFNGTIGALRILGPAGLRIDRLAVTEQRASDADGDFLADDLDNCPDLANTDQSDLDADGKGDLCNPQDADADGWNDAVDSCPRVANPDQLDSDRDGPGDACDPPDRTAPEEECGTAGGASGLALLAALALLATRRRALT